MEALKARWDYLFRSTKGLALVAIAMISLVTAIWGLISGPMAEWGVRDFVVGLLGMRMAEAEREGRIILLYHTVAVAMVAVDGKRLREAALPLYARREQGQLRI